MTFLFSASAALREKIDNDNEDDYDNDFTLK